MTRKTRRLVALAAVVAAVLPLSACGGDPTAGGGSGDSSTITIGSANFPENELLAEIYAQALEAKGVKVNRKFNIGARELYRPALDTAYNCEKPVGDVLQGVKSQVENALKG